MSTRTEELIQLARHFTIDDATGDIINSGKLTTDDITDATTTTDGSLQTDGGLSVVKKAVIGDDLTVNGASTLTGSVAVSDTTTSTDKDTGALVIEGGVGIEENLNVGGDLDVVGASTVGGDLDVTSNISVSSGLVLSPYQGILRNAIINGDMRVNQRVSSGTITNGAHSLDRWEYNKVGPMVHTITQEAVTSSEAPFDEGLQYALKIECTTLDAVVADDDWSAVTQFIEGYNFAPFVGKSVILSFWVKGSSEGIYSVGFMNDGVDKNYIADYEVTSAWSKVEIPITFDYSGGTWDYTNGQGLGVRFNLSAGANKRAAVDTWIATADWASPNQINACELGTETLYITGVQLHPGTVALPFDPRPYAEELRLCQRYCYSPDTSLVNTRIGVGNTGVATTISYISMNLPVSMRIPPSTGALTVTPAEWLISDFDVTYAVSNITINVGRGSDILAVLVVTHAAAGSNRPTDLIADGTAGRKIIISAEL